MNFKDCIKEIESGKREKGGALKQGIPSLGAEHLNENGSFNLEDSKMKYISNDFFEKMQKGKVKKGDIILVKDGATTGKVSFVDDTFPFEKVAINEHVFLIRTKEEYYNKYIFYLLYSEFGKKNVLNDFRGATIGGISKEFVNFNIKIPKIDEQIRIVKKLDKVQELINLSKEQNGLLDKLINNKFIDVFGNPNTNDKKFKKIKLRECLINIDNGKSFVCENFSRDNDYPAILKLSAVTYGYYNQEENKALIDKKMYIPNVEVKKGDLLFTRKNTPELVGMSAYVYDTLPNLMLPDLIFRLNTTEECNKVFLWKLINHKMFRKNITQISNGSAKSMSNISKERLMDLEIILPPIELQNKFADFIEKIEKQRKQIDKNLKEVETLKNGMMNKYFN